MNDRLKDALDSIHAEDELKEHTRRFLRRKLYNKSRRRTMTLRYAAVVCSLLFLAGFGGYLFYITPVSYISIDINPSIELGLNRLDRIVTVASFNEEGAVALANVELKNLKYEEAILVLLESQEISAYLTDQARISINVASDDRDKNAEIQERVMECTGDRYENVSCHGSSEADMHDAHYLGLSVGKYRAYVKLQSLAPDITAEDVRGMTMRQIQELIEEFSAGENEDTVDWDAEYEYDHWDSDENGSGHKGGHGGNGNENGGHRNRHSRS